MKVNNCLLTSEIFGATYSDNKRWVCLFDVASENAFIFRIVNNDLIYKNTLKGEGVFLSDSQIILFYNDSGYGYLNTDSYIYNVENDSIVPLYVDSYEEIINYSKYRGKSDSFFISRSSGLITTKEYLIIKDEFGGVYFYRKSAILSDKKLDHIYCFESKEDMRLLLSFNESNFMLEYEDYNNGIKKTFVDREKFSNIMISKQDSLKLKSIYFTGFSLDYHSISSRINEDGSFTTLRTNIGEMLFQIKYRNNKSYIPILSKIAAEFIQNKYKKIKIDFLIPIPASIINRPLQPVIELLKGISDYTHISYDSNYLIKQKEISEIKGIDDNETRKKILQDAFTVNDKKYKGKTILLFDDLYRSGETLSAAAKVLKEQGEVGNIIALTITKTRTKR